MRTKPLKNSVHCVLLKNLEQNNQIVTPKDVERRKAIAANKIKTEDQQIIKMVL